MSERKSGVNDIEWLYPAYREPAVRYMYKGWEGDIDEYPGREFQAGRSRAWQNILKNDQPLDHLDYLDRLDQPGQLSRQGAALATGNWMIAVILLIMAVYFLA